MHKLVWTENRLDSIFLHLVQEYEIRWHRYRTANGPCNVVPMVYEGLQSSFMSLAWPWSGRSLPTGKPVGVLRTWTGAHCGQAPSSPTTDYVTNLKSNRLIFVQMAGWMTNCSWLAVWLSCYLTKYQPDPTPQMYPQAETSCGQVWCYFTFGSGWPWVRCMPPGRDILWPSMILLEVRLSCVLGGKSGASSCCSNSSSISIYKSCCSSKARFDVNCLDDEI